MTEADRLVVRLLAAILRRLVRARLGDHYRDAAESDLALIDEALKEADDEPT